MAGKRIFILVALLLLSSFVLAPVGAQDDVIRVYTSWPLQGSMQPEGESMLRAAQLALDHYMADHDDAGPLGMNIEIVPLDDASPTTGSWDGTVEAENAQRCVNDPTCMVYFGTYNSGAAKVSMPITNEAGMAHITPANSYAGLTRACDTCEDGEPEIYRPSGVVNYFRTNPTDDVQGPAAASWAYCLGAQNVYVLDDTQLYGQGIADEFVRQAEAIGLNIVGRDSVESTDIDFRSLVTKVRGAGADMVFGGFVVDSGGPQVVQQMGELGLFDDDVTFMGPDGLLTPSFVEAAGGADNVNGNVFLTFPGVLPSLLTNEQGMRFYNDFVAEYGNDPTGYAVYAYQSMMLVLDSIDRAGVAERGPILDAMRETTDFEGLTGTFSFDENGDSTAAAFFGYEAADGVFMNPVPITPTMHEECTPAS